ncbi:MAG: leucine-rich repeat domain-containing protein, partial [Lachnospiraceae bacterium]|nr:leucine-rich repeat domain-containing protein [Lachnospiraceae bacterium]
MEDKAFWYCTALQTITLPSAVTYLGHGAFAGCSGLTELRIAIAFRAENDERYVVPVTLNEKMPDKVCANVD